MNPKRPIRCIEFSRDGYRAVIIEPDHPEYETLFRRNEEAGEVLDHHMFETRALKGFWRMFLWP